MNDLIFNWANSFNKTHSDLEGLLAICSCFLVLALMALSTFVAQPFSPVIKEKIKMMGGLFSMGAGFLVFGTCLYLVFSVKSNPEFYKVGQCFHQGSKWDNDHYLKVLAEMEKRNPEPKMERMIASMNENKVSPGSKTEHVRDFESIKNRIAETAPGDFLVVKSNASGVWVYSTLSNQIEPGFEIKRHRWRVPCSKDLALRFKVLQKDQVNRVVNN